MPYGLSKKLVFRTFSKAHTAVLEAGFGNPALFISYRVSAPLY
jgi:hypothetical protein